LCVASFVEYISKGVKIIHDDCVFAVECKTFLSLNLPKRRLIYTTTTNWITLICCTTNGGFYFISG